MDDLIFTSNNLRLFEEFKADMAREFKMTDTGFMSYYLGLEMKQMKDGIFISQESHAKEILKKFKMNDCKPVNTPMELGLKLSEHDDGEKVDPSTFKSLFESLRYALNMHKADILFAIGLISRYMETSSIIHMKAVKRILRYLKGTLDFGLFYSSSKKFKLVGYCDSDFAGDLDDRKSTVDFVFFMDDSALAGVQKNNQ